MQKPNFENFFTNLDSRNTTKQLVYFKHNVIQKLFMTNIISKLKKKIIHVYRGTCMQKKMLHLKNSQKKYTFMILLYNIVWEALEFTV